MKFDPDWVIAPGETLKEWFEEIGLPEPVCETYGIPVAQLRRIFSGQEKITPRLAQRLCNMTFIGAPMWLALEHNFRVGLAAGKHWERPTEGDER